MPRGGKRTPSKPAPASGPGRLSRRTDGGPAQKLRVASGGGYGERQETENLQRSAPLSNTATQVEQPSPGVDPSRLTPLDAPSAYPERDITYGLSDGPGPNPDEVFGQPRGQLDPKSRERLRRYLPTLMVLASGPEASEETKDFVRRLRADL